MWQVVFAHIPVKDRVIDSDVNGFLEEEEIQWGIVMLKEVGSRADLDQTAEKDSQDHLI